MRRGAAGLVLVLFAAACTSTPGRPSEPISPSPPAASPLVRPILLDVVADVTPQQFTRDGTNSYIEGMQLAVDVVNRSGGVDGRPIQLRLHDDQGDPGAAAGLMRSLHRDATAILYVGPGTSLLPLRPRLERTGTPVFLLEGDLYTSRSLFREVFQTTIPWAWQAAVIARYAVVDRQARDVVFFATGPEAEAAVEPTRSAVAYWGGQLTDAFADNSAESPADLTKPLQRAGRADAVITFEPPLDSLEGVNAIEEVANPLPSIGAASSLLVANRDLAHPEPRATACYTYTWAGWAQAIPRVAKFRNAFKRRFGRLPSGLEQEGYDAVRVLAQGLKATRGRGGRVLTAALERLPTVTYSSFPIDLGPDDHVFLPRDELGLFAVPGPRERLDRWQRRGDSDLWRPLMRTFTSDGKRTNIPDHDKRVFFPFWRKNRPAPFYWKSRYGITTKRSDPVH